MSGGYYIMKRGWQDHYIFKDEPYTEREAWEYLIAQASYHPHKIRHRGAICEVVRSQVPTSYRKLAEKWQWGINRVRSVLELWKREGMVSLKTDTGFLVITLCNYDQHQLKLRKSDTVSNTQVDTLADTLPDTVADTHSDTNIIKENKGEIRENKGEGTRARVTAPPALRFKKTLLEKRLGMGFLIGLQRRVEAGDKLDETHQAIYDAWQDEVKSRAVELPEVAAEIEKKRKIAAEYRNPLDPDVQEINDEMWERIKPKIRTIAGEPWYQSYFQYLRLVKRDGLKITLVIGTLFGREQVLSSDFYRHIFDAWSDELGDAPSIVIAIPSKNAPQHVKVATG